MSDTRLKYIYIYSDKRYLQSTFYTNKKNQNIISDLDSWDSVDAKNGLTCQDWTKDTRDTEWVLKWVIVRIAAFCCARQPQIWIPEIL